MAAYDSSNSMSKDSSPEARTSTTEALPFSSELMWEGWSHTKPATHSALTDRVPQIGGYSFISKNVDSSQYDIPPSWLIPGSHQQHNDGSSGIITQQGDPCQKNDSCSPVTAHERGLGGGSEDALPIYTQFYNSSMLNADSEVEADNIKESVEQFSTNSQIPCRVANLSAVGNNRLDGATLRMMGEISYPGIGLDFKALSSSSSSRLTSYSHIMDHLDGQSEASSHWQSGGILLTPASQFSNSGHEWSPIFQQPSKDSPGVTSDNSVLDEESLCQRKKESHGDAFSRSEHNITDQIHLYADHHHAPSSKYAEKSAYETVSRQLTVGNTVHVSSIPDSYDGHSCYSWPQITIDSMPNMCAGPSDANMVSIQDIDQAMFENNVGHPEVLSTAARTIDLSSTNACTTMSTIPTSSTQAASPPTAPLRHGSLWIDLDGSGSVRRRRLSQDSEQMGESDASAEDGKRSCIEHRRDLWQSQPNFGKVPSTFKFLGSSSESTAMDLQAAIGPALNTNGRPRARRGSATDPQSVYARHRRERINDRLKVLQNLVPNGARVDIVTMLEEAISYVKFLQVQVKLLSSDELWIYAPTTYNGVDVSMGMHPGLLNQNA